MVFLLLETRRRSGIASCCGPARLRPLQPLDDFVVNSHALLRSSEWELIVAYFETNTGCLVYF